MFFSRAEFLTEEDLQEFSLIDGKGLLMEKFDAACTDEFLDETERLPYFKKIIKGDLDPGDYGALLVLDAFYCYNAVISLNSCLKRMSVEREYSSMVGSVETLYNKYRTFASSFLKEWHLGSAIAETKEGDKALQSSLLETFVVPTENVKMYAEYERKGNEEEEPIYGLVYMFTCYAFWPRIFSRIQGRIKPDNIYKKWVDSNAGGHTAQVVDSLIQTEWVDKGRKISEDHIFDVFKQCLGHEYVMFKQASTQEQPLERV